MNSGESHPAWVGCLLGAINGLIFGVAAEFLRQVYGDYQARLVVQEFESQGMSPPLMIDMLSWWAIPISAVVAFIPIGFLVYRFGARRLKSWLLIWQVIGVLGVLAWSILWQLMLWSGPDGGYSIVGDVKRLSYGYTFGDLIMSGSFIRDVLVALVLIMGINLIYGAFIHMSLALYRGMRVQSRAT